MAMYTKINFDEMKQIAKLYNIRLLEMEAISGGAGNSSFLLLDGVKKYIFTIFEELIDFEVKNLSILLSHLRSHNFDTNQIIPTIEKKLVIEAKGKPAFLKKYIEGNVVEDLNDHQIYQLGEALAKLHLVPILAGKILSDRHNYGVEQFSKSFDKKVDAKYIKLLKNYHSRINDILTNDFPRGIIHGDLFFDNVLFRENKLIAIIDFEEVCNYYFVFDLGMTIIGCCLDNKKVNRSKVDQLLKGYQSKRKLLNIEKKNLYQFAAYAAIATSYWRFLKYNFLNPIPEKSQSHWETANIANELIDQIF